MMFRGKLVAVVSGLLAVATFTVSVAAQNESRRRRGLYGDWLVKMEFNGRSFDSILSFSRDSEGKRTAQWISWWGLSDLKDVKLEDGQLSFVRERRNRDGQTVKSTFKGSIKGGKLTGVLSGNRGDIKLEGERRRRIPRAAGNWELRFNVGDRQITNTLAVTVDKEGKLAVDWKSERVKHKITDVKWERRKLSFKTNSKMDDRQWKSTFEGTVRGNNLAATIKSDRGEIPVEGKRIAGIIVGTWNLELTSERGSRKQRLRIYPDMSGLFGTIPIKNVSFESGRVSFQTVLEFGDRQFEMGFKGVVKESTLTGELTTSRGTTKVTGMKVVRRQRSRRGSL